MKSNMRIRYLFTMLVFSLIFSYNAGFSADGAFRFCTIFTIGYFVLFLAEQMLNYSQKDREKAWQALVAYVGFSILSPVILIVIALKSDKNGWGVAIGGIGALFAIPACSFLYMAIAGYHFQIGWLKLLGTFAFVAIGIKFIRQDPKKAKDK